MPKPLIAPLPPSLQERCTAAPRFIAEVIDNRFVCHLPYYQQEEMFTRLGVRIHRKTLCDWTLLASDWLSIIYREIQPLTAEEFAEREPIWNARVLAQQERNKRIDEERAKRRAEAGEWRSRPMEFGESLRKAISG